jgi:hypothetical protein
MKDNNENIANDKDLMMIPSKTFICYCGSIIAMKQRLKHMASKKHLKHVEEQKKEQEE